MTDKAPNFTLLRAFIAFSEAPSIGEAAKTLGISQPALSYQLKRLQEEVPLPLFAFQGKRKTLTHYGRALLELARAESARIERNYEAINRVYLKPEQLALHIGCRRDRFARVERSIEFPGLIHFWNYSAADALAALLAHRIDVAVIHEPLNSPDLIAKELFFSSSRVVVHPKWVHAADPARAFQKLARDPGFLRDTPCLRYQERESFLTRWLHLHDVQPSEVRYRFTCQDWVTLIGWASDGHGYAVVPGDLAIPENLLSFDIPDKDLPGVQFYAAYHRSLRKIPGFSQALKIRDNGRN